jgi:hypothetical protein
VVKAAEFKQLMPYWGKGMVMCKWIVRFADGWRFGSFYRKELLVDF